MLKFSQETEPKKEIGGNEDMTSLTKKLFIANGRWLDRQHIYVCGYSKADAIRIWKNLLVALEV